jgi:transposase
MLNPIEYAFSKIKTILKNNITQENETLRNKMIYAIKKSHQKFVVVGLG